MRVVLILLTLAAMLCPAQQPPAGIDEQLTSARELYNKGAYAQAEATLSEAWSAASALPREDPRNYAILKLLSQTQTAAHNYEAAEETLQRAINWRETHEGRHHAALLADFTDLALICLGRNQPQRGLDILNYLLGPLISAHGAQSLALADHWAHTATLMLAANQPVSAAQSLTRSLDLRERLAGAGHPALLPGLDRLATVYLTLRDYPMAAQTHLRAIRIRERFLGPADPDLLANLDGLSYALFGQKDYEAAEPVFLRLLALWEANAGTHHPQVALTLDKLVTFYREWGREEPAEALAGRASALRVHFHAAGLVRRAGEWLAANEPAQARELYQQALALLNPPHPALEPLRKEIEEQLKLLAEPPAQP